MADRNVARSYLKRAAQIFSQLVVMAALLFGTAGDVHWTWAWVYFAFAIVNLAVNFIVFPREIVEARSEVHEDVPLWERIVTRTLLVLTLALFGVAGLDHRLHASPDLPMAIHLASLLPMAAGSALATWAIVSNRFFATQVRIQMERGHTVERGGPYRWIRHPGYAGFILTWLGLPVLLGALWACIPAFGIAVLFVVRTGLEDAFLRRSLSGYVEYANEVRARLVPGVW